MKARPMMMKKSLDLVKGILVYNMSEKVYEDASDGMVEFARYNYDIYEFTYQSDKWAKLEKL